MKILTIYRKMMAPVVFDERRNEWERVVIEDGALIVTRPDGTKRVFAQGSWIGYETELVEA